MDKRLEQLAAFFNQYAKRFNVSLKNNEPDVAETAKSFADCFIESSPLGVMCGKNDDQFLDAIPQGYTFYRSIGIKSMNITSKEITILDEYHAMVKVYWRSDYSKPDGADGSIHFHVIYLVATRDNVHKIFAYITGDEQQALREHGLVQ